LSGCPKELNIRRGGKKEKAESARKTISLINLTYFLREN